MLVWEGRQHDCNDDSQVRPAPSDFSSAPTCLAVRIYVSQHMFLYDNHLPCLIFAFVYCCMLHMLQVCSLKRDRNSAGMWPSTAFNCINTHIALLCRSSVCHPSSVCHVHRLCKIPMCGKQYINTRTTKQ